MGDLGHFVVNQEGTMTIDIDLTDFPLNLIFGKLLVVTDKRVDVN